MPPGLRVNAALGATAQKMPRPVRVQRDGMRQVLSHLDDTLARYDGAGKTGAKALSRMLRAHDDQLVIVHRGRIIVSRGHYKIWKEKPALHLRMMAEAASLLPNVAYLWTQEANGCGDDLWNKTAQTGACGLRRSRNLAHKMGHPCCSLPWLVMAKRLGTCECGLMVPNPFFLTMHRWRQKTSTLGNRSSQRPWMERNPRLFWRGHIVRTGSSHAPIGLSDARTRDGGCWRAVRRAGDFGNYVRLVATSLSEKRPDLFDVRASKRAAPPLTADSGCAALRHTHDDRKNPYFDAAARAALKILRKNATRYLHPYVPTTAFGEYQYFLNLPGTVSGSYSRNLNALWMLGGIVVLWSGSLHAEWYYPALAVGTSSQRNRIAIRASSYIAIASQSPCRAWRRAHARGDLEDDRRATALRHRR